MERRPSRRALVSGIGALGATAAITALAPSASAATAGTPMITQGVKYLTMYSQPRPNSLRIYSIPLGSTVVATGQTNASGSFTQVLYSGRQGWVMSHYVRQTPVPKTAFNQDWSYGGLSAKYHVYADGVDFSRPWSFAYYLDGDYYYPSRSRVVDPDHPTVRALAAEANRRNQVLIGTITPQFDSTNGYTWWVNKAANCAYFVALAKSLQSRFPSYDRDRQWLVGFSGGAEVISSVLLSRDQLAWQSRTGATIIAGGTPAATVDSADATFRSSQIRFHVASDDGSGATWPKAWSALGAATAGAKKLQDNGFTNVRLNIHQPGSAFTAGGHMSYDLDAIFAADMAEAGLR